MKKTLFQLLMLLASFSLFSCGGSDGDDSTPTPSVSLQLVSQSIAEGAQVDAASTTVLTLNYNNPVRVPGNGITLNGIAVKAKVSGNSSVEIPLALEANTVYTLKVAWGAIVAAADGKVVAPEFTLNFTTKGNQQPPVDENSPIAKKMGWGWNLGNHFDTSSGADGVRPQWGYWDNAKPTQVLYNNLRNAGASTVRIGVTWGNYQNTSNWDIDANYIAEVRQNVEWAEAAGLNVILNMHHDEYWLDIKGAANNATTNSNIKNRIEKTWKQIAEAFKDKGEFLIFESFNEIQDGGWGWGANRTDGGKQYKTLNEWNQLVVNTIRATGGNNATRWIGIPSYAANPSLALETGFVLPTDAANRLMVSVHFYDPSNFTLSPYVSDDSSEYKSGGYSEWGHTAAKGKADTGSNEDHVVAIFKKLHDKFVAKNIPVYIGEYGCVMHKNTRSNNFRNYYLEYVCRAAHEYGMPLCIWDNNASGGGNEHHGYFNHTDGQYLNAMEALVKTMIKAATSDDASYTLESVYNKAPK
ncbi:MAG: cellulase family glycosylhydrolase [Prevotella sp.]|nr:cellulase family glycosylhydrolase [Prevotella sp.]